MTKMRVHDLAKSLDKTSKEVIEFLRSQDVAVASHASSLEEEHVEMVKAKFANKPVEKPVEKVAEKPVEKPAEAPTEGAAPAEPPAPPSDESGLRTAPGYTDALWGQCHRRGGSGNVQPRSQCGRSGSGYCSADADLHLPD